MVQGQLKIGVMGTADIAVSRVIPNLTKSDRVNVQSIASREKGRAKQWAEELGIEGYFGSYDEMLRDGDVEAVYIPLVNSLHAEWSIKALSMGKHVLCEKPLALGSADARRMQQAAGDNGVVLMEGFQGARLDRVVVEQDAGPSGILGEYEVALAQRLLCPVRHVGEVADRCAYQIESAYPCHSPRAVSEPHPKVTGRPENIDILAEVRRSMFDVRCSIGPL